MLVKQWLVSLCISLLAVFAPINSVLITVFVLVVVDFIFGVLLAHKNKDLITSQGFRRTIVKLLTYEIVIGLGFLCETYLIGAALPLAKIIGGMIGMAELKSVLENSALLTSNPLLVQIEERIGGRVKKELGGQDGSDQRSP